MTVRSTDVDSDRIVNNAHYFEFFQEARLDHLRAIEVVGGPGNASNPSRSFTLAETTCTYRSPLRHRDKIVVRAWTKEVRNRSFILAYAIVRSDNGMVVAEGSSVQVWLDSEGAATPLPDVVRSLLVASLGADGS